MRNSISNSGHGKLEDTESFVRRLFPTLVNESFEKGDITESMKTALLNLKPIELDEVGEALQQLIHALKNKNYYQLLARIEKAEVVIAAETDMEKKDRYIKAMNELCDQLDQMMLLPFEPTHDELIAEEPILTGSAGRESA